LFFDYTKAEILLGFDVDSCCVGFDGKQVWAAEHAHRALCKRYNLLVMNIVYGNILNEVLLFVLLP
jgi:hypothetical protein